MSIEKILENLRIKKNDFVIIHGSYLPSILIKEKNPKVRLLNSLISYFKDYGSLFIPTFTYNFKKKNIKYNTKSDLGDFSNDFLKLKNIKRTKHPVFSFAYYPNIKTEKIVKKISLKNCFGKNSLFDLCYKKNGKIICFGTGFKHITFTIFVEESKKVKYRYMKNFIVNYEGKKRRINYFVRNLNIQSDLNYTQIKKKLKSNRGLIQYQKNRVIFYSFKSRDYFKACSQVIRDNPYGLIDEGNKNKL